MAEETKDLSPASEEPKESDAEEEMDTKEENEKPTGKEVKQEKNKAEEKGSKKGEDEEEEDDDEEEDEELQAGLLERPVVIEDGRKRERKKTERMTFQSPGGEEKKDYVEEGKGRRLGEIPYVEFMLNKTKADDCKPLHRVLYKRAGQVHLYFRAGKFHLSSLTKIKEGRSTVVKRMIRRFSGFPFSEKDPEYDKRMQVLKANKFTVKMLKTICDILDVSKIGSKEEIAERIMQWLLKPEDSGKKLPDKKRKRGKGKAKSEKGGEKKKKVRKTKAKPKKSKATADDDDNDDDSDDEKDDDAEDETKEESEESDKEESEEEESEEEEAPPKKKARKTTPKAKPKEKKEKKKPAPKPKKTTPKKKATPAKKKTKEIASDEEVSDISSDDSDDEPLVAQIKPKGPPTNDELKDVVKKMLENANLEEVTMKTVLKDVYAKYPSHDLTDKKDFIKNTVKQIIS